MGAAPPDALDCDPAADAAIGPLQPAESANGSVNGVTQALPTNGLTSSSPADSDATVAIYRTAHALATDGSETIPWHQHVTGPVLVPGSSSGELGGQGRRHL